MTGKPLRILVVDDEALIRWSLSEILGREGHKVVQSGQRQQRARSNGRRAGREAPSFS
jgi:DNA-binding NtrC family response regulator